MLNPFPDLLMLRFFAPTMLRITAAVVFFYVAYTVYTRRREIAHIALPFVGKGEWVAWVSAIFHAGIGFMLLGGYYTQWASLLGAVGTIKGMIWARRYAQLIPLSRGTAALLVMILLSLLITGAGAFAYDLPL